MNTIETTNSYSALNPAAVATNSKDSSELGQSDFIELLVAQVKNQDPTKPLEPSEFMNQLAQFSTVNGIQELKLAFDTLADKLSSDQSIQAANLVGRDVLVPGGKGRLESGGSLSGELSLSQQSSEVTLHVVNAYGENVRTLQMGGHDAGRVQFKWDGLSDDGSAVEPGIYTITADALIEGNTQAIAVSLETRIDSVTLNQDGSGTILNLASGESAPLGLVQQIK